MRESMVGRFVGASVGRVEDRRLLAGAGRYIDDVTVPGMLHAAFLRSPYPHAEIGSIDAAGRIVVERFDQHRHSNQPMETRGLVAEMDPSTGALTVHGTSQAAHALRWSLALFTGRRPLPRVVRQMMAQRERTAAIFAGIRDYLKETPALVAALKETAP